MDIKEAVKAAKQHVIYLFDDEKIWDIGLEEVKFDIVSQNWLITIGFSREWEQARPVLTMFEAAKKRTYKVVTIDQLGKVISLTDRVLPTPTS